MIMSNMCLNGCLLRCLHRPARFDQRDVKPSAHRFRGGWTHAAGAYELLGGPVGLTVTSRVPGWTVKVAGPDTWHTFTPE